MHVFRVTRIVSIMPKRTDDPCSFSLKARDIKDPHFDTALQERKSSYAGAPSSAGAQKHNKRASTPSNSGNLRGNIKIDRREISRRSPLRILGLLNEVPYDVLKDLFVVSAEAFFKSAVQLPSPKVAKPPEAASLPMEDSQATLPTNLDFKYTPEAGSEFASLLSDPCNGENCYAKVCSLSIPRPTHISCQQSFARPELTLRKTARQRTRRHLGRCMRRNLNPRATLKSIISVAFSLRNPSRRYLCNHHLNPT